MDDAQAELVASGVTLQQLRCASTVARLGSFTAAADALRVSQPAVAEQVRRLERALGVELFVRLARGVRPTTAGATFVRHADRTLGSLTEAAASVTALNALRGGTLTFGLFGHPIAYGFDRLAARFLREHPDMRLRLVGRNSSDVADRVRAGEVEAGVVTLPVEDRDLDVVALARDEVRYVSAAPARARAPVGAADLAGRPWVFYDAESGDADPIRRQLHARVQAQGGRLRARVEVENMTFAIRLVADGAGDTYLPRAHLADPSAAGLHSTTFDPPLYDTFALITRRGARPAPATRALLGLVREHLHEFAAAIDESGA